MLCCMKFCNFACLTQGAPGTLVRTGGGGLCGGITFTQPEPVFLIYKTEKKKFLIYLVCG